MTANKIFKIIIILVLIVFTIACLFYFFGAKKDTNPPVPIFSIVGKIMEIQHNSLKVKASKGQNSFNEEKEFLVFVDSTTTISFLETPLFMQKDDIHKPILSQQKNFNDLKIGDFVVVESSVDLQKTDFFNAVSLSVQNTGHKAED